MKRSILFLLVLSLFKLATAQDFNLNPKVTKGSGPNANFQIDAKSIITNNGNDSVFEWVILDITAPSGWSFGLCDPMNCLTDLAIGSKSTFTLGKGKSGEFKADFSPNNKGGLGKARVYVYPKNNPSALGDTLEIQVTAWATAVKEVAPAKEFSFFPNPAKEKLVIRYNARETMTIDVYNVLGTKVKTIQHTGFETEVNISDLQNGIYFIRFRDGNQTISKPFTKSE